MADFTINKLLANEKYSMGAKRDKSDVKYIVIHYTGNDGDTAEANAKYFAYTNTRTAGAHFFVDRKGIIYKSVNMNRVAWSVGGFYNTNNGAGSYYKKCTNANSVSIELCNIAKKNPSKKQIAATKWLIAYIQKNCVNANKVIRHWDVNGKACPATMTGKNNDLWETFKAQVAW